MELFQGGIASRLLPEVALYPQQRLARAQVGRNGISRLAELVGDGREEDAIFILRHDTHIPGWAAPRRSAEWLFYDYLLLRGNESLNLDGLGGSSIRCDQPGRTSGR
jgi:hypothetical protein